MPQKLIVIKTQFEAIHCWPECPIEEVSFLRTPHRHVFHVTVKWKVEHNDRDKEFILMKRSVTEFCRNVVDNHNNDLGRRSCEDIADMIHNAYLDACFVSVFEDNENGVEAIYD
jgi:hypothetical protein